MVGVQAEDGGPGRQVEYPDISHPIRNGPEGDRVGTSVEDGDRCQIGAESDRPGGDRGVCRAGKGAHQPTGDVEEVHVAGRYLGGDRHQRPIWRCGRKEGDWSRREAGDQAPIGDRPGHGADRLGTRPGSTADRDVEGLRRDEKGQLPVHVELADGGGGELADTCLEGLPLSHAPLQESDDGQHAHQHQATGESSHRPAPASPGGPDISGSLGDAGVDVPGLVAGQDHIGLRGPGFHVLETHPSQ